MTRNNALTATLLLSAALCGRAQETGSVQVATMAPNNKTVAMYYRVPKGYDAARQESYRVLVIFGGRNATGQQDATGSYWYECEESTRNSPKH